MAAIAKLDQATLQALCDVLRATDTGLAGARDILLFHVFGIPVTRATADVDFAIAVDSLERFRGLPGRPGVGEEIATILLQ
jgi:predicted nucleotidyltransferase